MIKHKILNNDLKIYIFKTLNTVENVDYLLEFLKLCNDINLINLIDPSLFDLRIQTLLKELKSEIQKPLKNYKLDCNKLNCTKLPKISHKILINNIIEEYLFLDEIDEVKTFIQNYILKKNLQIIFVETVLIYGKENNLKKQMTNLLEMVTETLKQKPVNKNKFENI